MAKITFTISDAKLPRIISAMKGLYPIPMIEDPEWVDPGDGSTAPMIPEFTDNEWAKEAVRRWIRNQVARWEQKVAKDAIIYAPEDDIIS